MWNSYVDQLLLEVLSYSNSGYAPVGGGGGVFRCDCKGKTERCAGCVRVHKLGILCCATRQNISMCVNIRPVCVPSRSIGFTY